MKKKSIVVHPFLLAAYPVLFLYSHNIGETVLREIFAPLAITVGLTLLAWYILGIILKNWKKSGVIVSLFLVLFFSYAYFRAPLKEKTLILLISLVWIALFMLGSLLTVVSRKDFAKYTLILNVIAGALIAMPVLNIIAHQLRNVRQISRDLNPIPIQTDSQSTTQKQSSPDIYFIILDAYAREDILRQIYNFDNSEFIDFLRKKGFYIAERSASNYCQTGLSIGSCFNLSYLDEQVEKIGENNTSHLPLNIVIQNSLIFDYLKKQGYKIVAFASDKPELELQNVADNYIKQGTPINLFYNAFKNMTPLPYITLFKSNFNEFDKYRRSILYILDNVGEIPNHFQSPKFVFVYIEAPHPPFVFGPNGEAKNTEKWLNDHDGDWLIRLGRLSLEEYRKHYKEQLIFINGRMKKVVNEILKNSEHPPIIMILGDHGPRSGMVWEDQEKTNVCECMSILNAYYLPNNGDKLLYPQISPVNSFRVILNYYFGQQFDLLPDKHYFSKAKYLYKFYDVTERVRNKP